MGSLYRSQDMSLIRIFIPADTAKSVLQELGKITAIQFKDLNPKVNAFQRNFISEIKRINELERKLQYFRAQLKLRNLSAGTERKNDIEKEATIVFNEDEDIVVQHAVTIDYLEETFDNFENEMQQISNHHTLLSDQYIRLQEVLQVINQISPIFDLFDNIRLSGDQNDQLRFVVGTINRDKVQGIERVLWRTLKSNLYLHTSEIEEPINSKGEIEDKNAFIVFYQGDRTSQRVQRICDAFGCSLFQLPLQQNDRDDLKHETENQLMDLKGVIAKSDEGRDALFRLIQPKIEVWEKFLYAEKAIYHAMNLFEYDFGRRCLVGEGWVPSKHINDVHLAARTGSEKAGGIIYPIIEIIKTKQQPPTYHQTNNFTKPFQDIVDMYGQCHYKEANPGVFTIITFPFLFGVMFGDVGHGFLLLFPALYMLLFAKFSQFTESKTKNKLEQYGWLMLLMSLFSIYCGFMYNELFAIPMQIFPTNWRYEYPITRGEYAHQIDPYYCYPFGVDPMWKGANNELDYYNSLKMKLSILLGVTQMMLGIIISSTNYIYFKKKIDFIFSFIPQILFLSSIFGYMCILIVTKWLIQWPTGDAPRLLNLMIEMLLTPWTLSPKFVIYEYQHIVQMALVVIAVVCVPIMLFPKPIILWILHRRKQRAHFVDDSEIELSDLSKTNDNLIEDDDEDESDEHGGEHGSFDFGELFVHQCIHTIEFVLGCISNTASYLRLWALSLAHSELAGVFYERILLQIGIDSSNFFVIFVSWAVWAVLTLGVLLGMESMSALLHALRLHWVEFQNKFYLADGYKFVPFSLEPLEDEDDD